MDQPIDAPEPPTNLSEELIKEIDSLSAQDLRTLVKYARYRIEYLETPIPDLIEPDDDEEIIRIEEYDIYTIVVKGEKCEESCEDCPHDPRVFVVTIEPEMDGERHLHWEDIGPMLER